MEQPGFVLAVKWDFWMNLEKKLLVTTAIGSPQSCGHMVRPVLSLSFPIFLRSHLSDGIVNSQIPKHLYVAGLIFAGRVEYFGVC